MAKQGKIIRNGITYSGGGGGCDIMYLTQAQYDALPESKLTNGVEYRITDNNPPAPTAKDMAYDNSESGIDAENVQDAIDTVNNSLAKSNYGVPLIFQNYEDGVLAWAHLPQNKTNVRLTNMQITGVGNQAEYCEIQYYPVNGLVYVISVNAHYKNYVCYGVFEFDD